jgi:hypothetical protein
MSSRSFGRRLLAGLWLGGVVATCLTLVGAPWPLPLDAGLLAHVSGLLAGYLAPVMVMLMSRTPVLETRVGSDVLARWHSRGGRLFLGLVLTHAAAAVQAWAASRQQDLPTALTSVLGLPWLAEATLGTGLFVLIAGCRCGSPDGRSPTRPGTGSTC